MSPRPIEGSLNFRAVAPCSVAGGALKPFTLYRSGEFGGVTAHGIATLQDIGLTTLFDLRSTTERKHRPSPFMNLPAFTVLFENHQIRAGNLTTIITDTSATAQDCANAMKDVYAQSPVLFGTTFRKYIHALIESPSPITVHCAAGKDRTGMAVALVLDLLGASRNDIMDDYLKTNAARAALRERFRERNIGLGLSVAADHLIEPLIAAEPDYLNAMFAAIKRNHGDTRTYARQVLAFTDDDVARLRQRLMA